MVHRRRPAAARVPDGRADLPGLALLIAGQIRAFADSSVYHEVHRTVATAAAAVFVHVSTEHTYSAWHRRKHDWVEIFSNETRSAETADLNAIVRCFKPLHWEVATDDTIRRHPRWSGMLKDDSASISTLAFRWLMLYDALCAAENVRGRRYAVVMRTRPDALLPCVLPEDTTMLLGGYSAVVDKDSVLLMQRNAAEVALTVYNQASTHPACALKAELCVPALLLEHGLTVGVTGAAGAIVRPEALCRYFSTSSFALDIGARCGREYLTSRKPVCTQLPAGPWNLTKRTLYWRARRGERWAASNVSAPRP